MSSNNWNVSFYHLSIRKIEREEFFDAGNYGWNLWLKFLELIEFMLDKFKCDKLNCNFKCKRMTINNFLIDFSANQNFFSNFMSFQSNLCELQKISLINMSFEWAATWERTSNKKFKIMILFLYSFFLHRVCVCVI